MAVVFKRQTCRRREEGEPMVRVERIELSFQAWEAHVLPLHHTRPAIHED